MTSWLADWLAVGGGGGGGAAAAAGCVDRG